MTYCGKRAPYPLFIYMEGKRALVVGAGKVAERKIATLREYGASVHVVAPDATPKIQEWAHAHLIQWTPRAYESGDISDAFLVFAATSSTQVNKQVFLDAEAHNCLCNVVDVPVLCNCIVPSLMRRGDLQIAVSSGGAAPTVAKHIRHALEVQYPAYWEEYVRVLGELRTLIKQRVEGDAVNRTPLFEAVAQAGLEKRVEQGEQLDIYALYDEIVAPLLRRPAQGHHHVADCARERAGKRVRERAGESAGERAAECASERAAERAFNYAGDYAADRASNSAYDYAGDYTNFEALTCDDFQEGSAR